MGCRHQWFVPQNGFECQLWIKLIEERWTSKWIRVPYEERYIEWVRVSYGLRFLKWVGVPWRSQIHLKVESYKHLWPELFPKRRSVQKKMLSEIFQIVIYWVIWTQVICFYTIWISLRCLSISLLCKCAHVLFYREA